MRGIFLICVPMDRCRDAFYGLLRMAIDKECRSSFFPYTLNADEWIALHAECLKQLIAGIAYRAITHLPKDQRPPMDLIFQWASEAETIKGHNKLLNAETARITELFKGHGKATAVLKGPANARLYPDPGMRQAGDIDLWVEGGKESLVELITTLGFEFNEEDLRPTHHIHTNSPTSPGVAIEFHFKPSSGNKNPFTNARLQKYLSAEIQKTEQTAEGFYVPSIKFALVMQLAHVQSHFLGSGVGFKQIVDYYMLLQLASESDLREVSAMLRKFGLKHAAAALTWLLVQVFELESSKWLCKPDRRRGKLLLAEVFDGGNFGFSSSRENPDSTFVAHWFKRRIHALKLLWFAPAETLWYECDYWKTFLKSIPIRIRLRKVSLWHEV